MFFGGGGFHDFPGGMPGGMPGMGGRGRQAQVDTDSLYKVLAVDKSASDSEIKKAYRKLAMKHHPDKGLAALSSHSCSVMLAFLLCTESCLRPVCFLTETNSIIKIAQVLCPCSLSEVLIVTCLPVIFRTCILDLLVGLYRRR
jgi:hypothetical protein